MCGRVIGAANGEGAMTNELHTKDFLALELLKAALPDMALAAVNGYYHDFLSPLALPDIQLAIDLEAAGTYAAMAIYKRHLRGEFDARKEEKP